MVENEWEAKQKGLEAKTEVPQACKNLRITISKSYKSAEI